MMTYFRSSFLPSSSGSSYPNITFRAASSSEMFITITRRLEYSSRLKKSNKMQQYADIHLLLNYSTCFDRPSRPSSGVHKTVVAASGTDHTIWRASLLKREKIRTFEQACSPDSTICTRGCNYSFVYS